MARIFHIHLQKKVDLQRLLGLPCTGCPEKVPYVFCKSSFTKQTTFASSWPLPSAGFSRRFFSLHLKVRQLLTRRYRLSIYMYYIVLPRVEYHPPRDVLDDALDDRNYLPLLLQFDSNIR